MLNDVRCFPKHMFIYQPLDPEMGSNVSTSDHSPGGSVGKAEKIVSAECGAALKCRQI